MFNEHQLLSRQPQRTSIWLPSVFRSAFRVDRRGVEPRLPECKSGVFPLDQQPASFGASSRSRALNFTYGAVSCPMAAGSHHYSSLFWRVRFPDERVFVDTRRRAWRVTNALGHSGRPINSTRKLQAPDSNRATDLMRVSSVPNWLAVCGDISCSLSDPDGTRTRVG